MLHLGAAIVHRYYDRPTGERHTAMNIELLALVAGAVTLEVIGQVCFKLGANRKDIAAAHTTSGLWRAIRSNPWIRRGIAAYLLELVLWFFVLSQAALSLAFPLLSLSYCGVAIAGRLFLGERISKRTAGGILLISLGTALVSWQMH